jgi:hypothetical protein
MYYIDIIIEFTPTAWFPYKVVMVVKIESRSFSTASL